MSTDNNKQDTGEISINFGEIFNSLKKNSLLIIITTFIFSAMGGLYSFTLNNEFESVAKVLPESNANTGLSGNLGGLSSLAGLAGISLVMDKIMEIYLRLVFIPISFKAAHF
jgi:uncharacterized protein involved in exopolysaccharide biosynthesis